MTVGCAHLRSWLLRHTGGDVMTIAGLQDPSDQYDRILPILLMRPKEGIPESDTIGQTVNEDSMDAKKKNQEKTPHSGTTSVQDDDFQ